MIKYLTLLIFSAMTSMAIAQGPSGCGSSNWASTIAKNTTQTFTVPSLSGATYRWVVSNSKLQIMSGQGTPTVTIRGNSCGTGTLYVTRYKDGVSACADKKTINVTGCIIGDPDPVRCSAFVTYTMCSQYNQLGHNSLIDVEVSVTNPWNTGATVEVVAHPAFLSNAFNHVSGPYPLLPSETRLALCQFSMFSSDHSNPVGWYTPVKVTYTQNGTGLTCVRYLNPLITGCSGSPARLANPETGIAPLPVEMQLYDMNGRKFMDQKVDGELPQLKSSPPGLHILNIRKSDGSVEKRKVMLEMP